jgi:hypothetical protein
MTFKPYTDCKNCKHLIQEKSSSKNSIISPKYYGMCTTLVVNSDWTSQQEENFFFIEDSFRRTFGPNEYIPPECKDSLYTLKKFNPIWCFTF